MNVIRRYRIKKGDYEQALAWVRIQKVDEADDEKSPEPLQQLGFRMPADYLPKVTWAHKTPLRLHTGKHGKHWIEVSEGNVWKKLVHEHNIDALLREQLLSSSSDVPLSRDAGYHIVQKRTVGISRRAFAKFIARQAVLQITKDKLPVQKHRGKPLEGRGYLEIDLVEAKGTDIGKYVHHPVSNFYFITLIDRLTGWLEVTQIPNKYIKTVEPKIEQMLKRMAKMLKTKIKYIRSDAGSEFLGDTAKLFDRMGIRHKFVKAGNRIEQANKTFQKTWYRLLRLGRGDLRELDAQATAIFNNTLSSVTGFTPLEALDVADSVLTAAFNESRKKKIIPKYKIVPIEKGDRVRYLLLSEVGKHGKALKYKSYRGKHWSHQVHTVVKYNKHEDKYYVGGAWRFRDKLLKVPGIDKITHDAVVQKHRQRLKTYRDEIGDMALAPDHYP